MQICFYANLRALVGKPALDILDPNVNTLRLMFEHLLVLYPEMATHLLDERGNLRPDVPVFVNGRNPRLENAGLDLALAPGDVISLFSPIASGKMNVEVMREPAFGRQE